MKLIDYLRVLPIEEKNHLWLIKAHKNMKLRFSSGDQSYRLKHVFKRDIDDPRGRLEAAETNDMRKTVYVAAWPIYEVNKRDAMKLIFEYPWTQ